MTPITTARLATCVVAATLVSAAAATLPTEARAGDGIASVPETPVPVASVDADAMLEGAASAAVAGVVADALGGAEQATGETEPAAADSTAAPATAPPAAAAPPVETTPIHASSTPDTTPVSADTAGGIAATVPPSTPTPATVAAAAQVAPSNVNVSVRIGSPGDNGPVTQVNVAASAAAAGASPASAATSSTAAAPTGTAAGTSAAPTGAHAASAAPSASQDDPETWSWQWNCMSMPDLSVIPPVGSMSGSVPKNWTWIWNCGENPTQYQGTTSAQYQPSNVNIAIRISSPGNDGPVTQANVAVATRVGSVSVAAPQPGPGLVLPLPIAVSAASDVLSDAVIPSMTSLQTLVAAEPIWLGDDVIIPATVGSIVELPQTLLPLLGLRATGAVDRQWLGFPGRGSRLAAPAGPFAPVGLLEPETSTTGSSGWAVASAVGRSAQPQASTSGAAEKPRPAPRWRAPLRKPMQAPVPSGASFAPATGGGSSGGGIPIFLALPFLAAMADLARRVALDRVALPSGHRSRVPENPG